LLFRQYRLYAHCPDTFSDLSYLDVIRSFSVQVLKQCSEDLTRENVMRQAANLRHLELPMLAPGITINTSPTDFAPIKQVQMERFDGEHFIPIGPILEGAIG
jgi:branched-chain amino acid transport system substrate-binding protein